MLPDQTVYWIPGDKVNPLLEELREQGYDVLPKGLDRSIARDNDTWTIVFCPGTPCAGEHPDCYGIAPKGDFLCHPCRGFAAFLR